MFEGLKAQLQQILAEIEKRPQDRHEFYLDLHGKLNAVRAMAMTVPADLLRLEKDLEAEFARSKQQADKTSRPAAHSDNPAHRG